MDRNEIELIIRRATGKEPRYRRVGSCSRCGKCCLNEDCAHYSWDEETKTASCLIFGQPERPGMCTDFPDNPPILIKTCGYKFLDIWEDDKELGLHEV